MDEQKPQLLAADLRAGQVLGTVSDEQLATYRDLEAHQRRLVQTLEVTATELADVQNKLMSLWGKVLQAHSVPSKGALEAFGLGVRVQVALGAGHQPGTLFVVNADEPT